MLTLNAMNVWNVDGMFRMNFVNFLTLKCGSRLNFYRHETITNSFFSIRLSWFTCMRFFNSFIDFFFGVFFSPNSIVYIWWDHQTTHVFCVCMYFMLLLNRSCWGGVFHSPLSDLIRFCVCAWCCFISYVIFFFILLLRVGKNNNMRVKNWNNEII